MNQDDEIEHLRNRRKVDAQVIEWLQNRLAELTEENTALRGWQVPTESAVCGGTFTIEGKTTPKPSEPGARDTVVGPTFIIPVVDDGEERK